MNIKAKAKKATKDLSPQAMEEVFSRVAEYFNVLSEPSRLRIMYAVCSG